jgi:hypothetical protein
MVAHWELHWVWLHPYERQRASWQRTGRISRPGSDDLGAGPGVAGGAGDVAAAVMAL